MTVREFLALSVQVGGLVFSATQDHQIRRGGAGALAAPESAAATSDPDTSLQHNPDVVE